MPCPPRRDRRRRPAGSARTSCGVPLARIAAVDQHRDAVGEREHRVHVVLDQQHREAALEAAQQLRPAARVSSRPGAGHRLVEQQQLRLHRERDGELQRALLAMRELAGRTSRAVGEPDLLERRHAPARSARPRRAARPKKRKLEPVRACTASATFSSAVKPRQDRGDLERCARARAARARAPAARVTSSPSKTMRPGVGRERAGDLVDQRGLAGAVRADHARAVRPARMSSVTSSVTRSPPKCLRQAFEAQHAAQLTARLPTAAPPGQSARRARTARPAPAAARRSPSNAR